MKSALALGATVMVAAVEAYSLVPDAGLSRRTPATTTTPPPRVSVPAATRAAPPTPPSATEPPASPAAKASVVQGPVPTVTCEPLVELARGILARGSSAVLAAFHSGEPSLRRALACALLENPKALADHRLQLGLALLAREKDPELAALALDLMTRNPRADATTVQELRAIALGAEPEVRARAAVALGLVAAEHGELAPAASAALLSYLATAGAARADVLAVLRLDGAKPEDVKRVVAALSDRDPRVRVGAARALATTDGEGRALAAPALRAALAMETDARAVEAIRASEARLEHEALAMAAREQGR